MIARHRMQSTPRGRLGLLLSIGLVSMAIVVLLGWRFFLPVAPLDEGIILAYPELILNGRLINLEFCSLYPPGTYWIVAIAFKLFGPSLVAERSVGLLYVLLLALALLALGRPSGRMTAVLAASMCPAILCFFPAAMAAYAWFGGIALLLWMLVLGELRLAWPPDSAAGDRLLMATGILGGLAIVFRHDLAPAALVSSVVLSGVRPKNVAILALGFFVGTFPLLIHTILATFPAVYQNLVTDVLRADAGRRLPIPYRTPLFWVVVVSCFGPLIAVLVKLAIPPWQERDRALIAVACVCLLILPQATSRVDFWHLIYIGCITIPLSLIAIWQVLGRLRARNINDRAGFLTASILKAQPGSALAVLVATTLVLISLSSGPELFRQISLLRSNGEWVCANCVRNEKRLLPIGDLAPMAQAIVNDLQRASRLGNSVLVGPRDLGRTIYTDSYLLYFFPHLIWNQYYIEMAPGISDRVGSRMAADVAGADFLLLDSAYDKWVEPNASATRGSEEPLRVMEQRFCIMSEHGSFSLYRRCGAMGSS